MIRTYLSIALLFLFSAALTGQSNYSFGPVAGLGIAGAWKNKANGNSRDIGKPGIAWSLGLTQYLKINENWNIEVDVLWTQHNFEKYREYKFFDVSTNDEIFSQGGDSIKLKAIAIPVRLRRNFSIAGKSFSFYFGAQYGIQMDAELINFQRRRNITTGEETWRFSNNYKTGSGQSIFDELTIDKKMRTRALGGIGLTINKHLQLDVDVQIPIGQNSAVYWKAFFDYGGEDSIDYNDLTMALRLSYRIL